MIGAGAVGRSTASTYAPQALSGSSGPISEAAPTTGTRRPGSGRRSGWSVTRPTAAAADGSIALAATQRSSRPEKLVAGRPAWSPSGTRSSPTGAAVPSRHREPSARAGGVATAAASATSRPSRSKTRRSCAEARPARAMPSAASADAAAAAVTSRKAPR